MIRAIITDFDGTLVDTFEANLKAYQKAFQLVGINLTEDAYRQCFGFRFDRLMKAMSISDNIKANLIREAKRQYYPDFFNYLKPNHALISLLDTFHTLGGKTAIASTARKENLLNAIDYLGVGNIFDVIYTGVDVTQGKPSPEIYHKTMQAINVTPAETLIFEDSQVGIEAAKASGANLMIVTPEQFI